MEIKSSTRLCRLQIVVCSCLCFILDLKYRDDIVTLAPTSKSYPVLTGLMAALSFSLIHQQAHELEKRQTRLTEERLCQNITLLNL